MRSRLVGLLLPVGVLCLAGTARAQDSANAATGQVIYDQATQAMDRKDYATACPKLEEVVRLVPDGVGARITLGECYEGAGKLASAWSAYTGAEATASRIGQAARAEKARRAAEVLKPRLATLTIQVPQAVSKLSGLTVQRDGVPIGPATWGIALPVDRGSHAIKVSANGKQTLHKTAEIPSDGAAITVTIDPLADGSGGDDDPRSSGGKTSPLVYAGFITAGVGIGVGAVTGIMTISSGSPCVSAGGCPTSTLESAKTTAWVSDIAFGVGLAGAAVGVVALVTSKPKGTSAAFRLSPNRLSFEGTF